MGVAKNKPKYPIPSRVGRGKIMEEFIFWSRTAVVHQVSFWEHAPMAPSVMARRVVMGGRYIEELGLS